MSTRGNERTAAKNALSGVTLTRVLGRPTFKNVALTRKEIAAVYARTKTGHDAFPLGSRFGFAAAVMKTAKYRRLHNAHCAAGDDLDDDWEFEHPERPSAYDSSILSTASDFVKRKKETQHREKIEQFDTFDGHEAYFKEAIEGAYDAVWLKTLCDDVLGFSHLTVGEMLDHLETQCLSLTDRAKAKKLRDIHVEWDKNDDVATFFDNLDKLEEEMADDFSITWPEEMKIIAAVEAMYDSGAFTRDEMIEWEDKDEADKTWDELQTHFINIFNKNQRYGGTTAQGHGFGEAANGAAEEPNPAAVIKEAMKEVALAATADKEHIQQMSNTTDDMLALVKRQQETIERQSQQISDLIEQNKKVADAIENLKSAQPSNPTPRPPPRQPGAGRGGGRGGGRGRGRGGLPSNKRPRTDKNPKDEADKKVCPVCGGNHKTVDCYELECNAHRRPPNWISKFA